MPLRKPALLRIKLKPVRLKSCTKLIVSTSVKSRNLTEIYKMEGSLLEFPQVVVHSGHVFT